MDALKLDSKIRSWSLAALRGSWIPALVVSLWLPMISRHLLMDPRLGGDAAIYIDCARSIVEGRGFMTRPWASLGDELWRPMHAFPPGYPLVIASGMVVGFPAYNASRIISVLSGTVFLFLAVRLMADRLPAGLAILGGFVMAFMQPYLFVSTVTGSDALYLPLMLVSLVLLAKATRSNNEIHLGWAIAAGVLAGAGYTVRNAAVALIGASFAYLLLQRVWLSWTRVARGVVAWGVGCGLGGGWLVAHNLIAFGTTQPYSMRPSELSLPEVTHAALRQMATDLVASQRFGQWVESENGWPAFLLAAGLMGISVCLVLRGSRWSASTIRTMARHRLEILLTLFSLCHVSLVIIARSVYGWGELVSGRHFVPIYWILILLGLMLMWVAADRIRWRRIVRSAVVVATLIAAGLQVRRAVLESVDLRPSKLSPAAIELLAAQVGRDQIVLSDAATALRVFGNLNARYPGRLLMREPEVTLEEITAAARSGLLWGVVAVSENSFRRGLYGHALKSLVHEPEHHSEWKVSRLPGSEVRVLQMMGKQ